MYRAARAAAERGGFLSRGAMTAASLLIALLASGCASIQAGPPRLYALDEEAAIIRGSLREMNLIEFSRLDEASRVKFRNDWLAGRMYAMDMQYTAYEAALTRERQGVGFGAAVATIGLTTASTLVSAVATKDILTGTAGAVTGARAAYDNDVLLAHSVQWIQSQMRTQRSVVAERILRGMKASTIDYPLAAALLDLEDYYRAGTFTGGVLSTTETLGAEARFAESAKAQRIEVAFVSTAAGRALRTCLLRPGVTSDQLVNLMAQPSRRNFALLLTGQSPEVAQIVLQRARNAGICP